MKHLQARQLPSLILCICGLLFATFGQTAGLHAQSSTPNPQDLLRAVDAASNFAGQDFSAEYTITQERAGQGTSTTRAAVFRRDRDDKFLVLVLAPDSEKGKGYLKIGNNLWLYDPVARRFTVTSARDRFLNSGARTGDLFKSAMAAEYRAVSVTPNQELGAYNTNLLELEALTADSPFPRRKLWVDQNNLVRKIEDYSLSGQLLRTTVVPTYQNFGGVQVPLQIVIVDALRGANQGGAFRGDRTVVAVSRGSTNAVPDLVFTQNYLERTGR